MLISYITITTMTPFRNDSELQYLKCVKNITESCSNGKDVQLPTDRAAWEKKLQFPSGIHSFYAALRTVGPREYLPKLLYSLEMLHVITYSSFPVKC